MKLGTMKAALPASLNDADQVFCYAGGVDWDVAEALAPLGSKLHVGKDFDAFVARNREKYRSRGPYFGHEQRRFRRNTREAAGSIEISLSPITKASEKFSDGLLSCAN